MKIVLTRRAATYDCVSTNNSAENKRHGSKQK